MSSILPSNYYQLSSLQTGATASSTTGNTSGNSTASLVQTLAQALSGSSGSGSSSSGSSDAYLLDLSPSAQSLLGGSSGSGSASTSTHFTLTSAQEKQIETIIEKYKNAPYDQATFNSIQNDLEAAGLGADQLSAQDQISAFNPTNTLLSALSGNYASLTNPQTTQSNEATKASNYMESILSDWKSISTTASSTSSSSGTSSATSTSLS